MWGEGHVNDLGAERGEIGNGLLHEAAYVRLHSGNEILLGNTDAHAAHVAGEGSAEVGHRFRTRRGVERVVTGDGLQEQGAVLDIAAERADLVERGGKGDQAVARHAAVGGLEANHATQRSRLADRAAGVCAQGDETFTSSDGRRRPAAGPAGHAVEVPRIVGGEEAGVLG